MNIRLVKRYTVETEKLIELHKTQLKSKETLISSMKRDRETLEQYEGRE